jgi:glycosyltransferase involved in cell wall biosynthesis
LPTFNRADSLPRSINSVLEQTYGDLELVVVDDGSTDGTQEIVGASKDARLRYVQLPRNRGQSVARNIGVGACRGALIAFQDSDDTWLCDKLARQVDALDRDPGLAGVYSDLMRIPRNGKPFVIEAPTLVRGGMFDSRPSFYQSYSIGIQSCVFRREILKRRRLFREDMRCWEDLELLLRLSRRHRFQRIPRPLVDYYEGDGVSTNFAAECDARIFLFQRYGYRGALANSAAWHREARFYLERRKAGLSAALDKLRAPLGQSAGRLKALFTGPLPPRQ